MIHTLPLFCAPHPAPCRRGGSDDDDKYSKEARKEVLLSGLVTAVGIALHNAPEGVAVFLAAQKSPAIGLSLAVAIAAHNIPEGVAGVWCMCNWLGGGLGLGLLCSKLEGGGGAGGA